MSVSNVFYATTSLSPAILILPSFRATHQENHFDEQNIIFQDSHESLGGARIYRGSREVTRTSKSTCLYGLTSGIAASFLLENPLPLLLGLSDCFSGAYAQQKVGNEFQVNTYTIDVSSSSVASFKNDNFVVTWMCKYQDGSNWGVYGQLFDGKGTKIGNEFQVNTYINFAQNPSVASFLNGNFVVTWNGEPNLGVYDQLFDGNGTKIGNVSQVNTYTNYSTWLPSVASFSNGNFVVTWHSDDQDGSVYGVYGQLFDGNGSKIGSEFRANTYTNNSQAYPSVASFSNGNFVVTWNSWKQKEDWDNGVYGQLFDGKGTKIGSEFHANTYITNNQQSPSVASLADGNFVVTWESKLQDGSVYGVYGQLFDGTGTKIGNEFQVNTYTKFSQEKPSVAGLADDNFVVTWVSDVQDGSSYGIFGQIFSGNGSRISRIGSEFQVNTYTNFSQWGPSVASLADGNFVVTWGRYKPYGSEWGIFGQIFHSSITSKTTLSPSDPSNRFSWVWFLLGGVGAVSCLGLTGYFLFKSRNRQKDGDVLASELGERGPTDDSTEKKQYRRPLIT